MLSIFKLIRTAPLTERQASRDGTIYMRRAMYLVGWTQPKDRKFRYIYLLWTIVAFAFGVFYFPVGFFISYGTQFKHFSPGQFLTSLQVAINVCGTSTKAVITYILQWRLSQVEILIDKLDKRILNDEDRKKVHITVARCSKAFLFFTFIYNGYSTSTTSASVLSGRPPWSIYNPLLDWRNGFGSLCIQSLFEFFLMSLSIGNAQVGDSYPLLYLLILRTHFDILKSHVRNLRQDPDKSEAENYQELVNCIMDHKLILKCCDTIRPIIERTIFVQFGLIGSVLGLTLINLFFFSDIRSGVASCFYICTALLQTFPFCYTCNQLLDDTDDLVNTIFESNWGDAKPGYKMTLQIFMHHVQQPIIFIAGGIFPISMNSNISVAKFAFSIITVVRQMNLDEKFSKTAKEFD